MDAVRTTHLCFEGALLALFSSSSRSFSAWKFLVAPCSMV
jgi:hypothetical protein